MLYQLSYYRRLCPLRAFFGAKIVKAFDLASAREEKYRLQRLASEEEAGGPPEALQKAGDPIADAQQE